MTVEIPTDRFRPVPISPEEQANLEARRREYDAKLKEDWEKRHKRGTQGLTGLSLSATIIRPAEG